MTLDTSLRVKVGGNKVRNVLTRDERVQQLIAKGQWTEGNAVYGMPKVRVEKLSLKKKKKVKGPEEGAGAAEPAKKK